MIKKIQRLKWDNINLLILVKFLSSLYFYIPFMSLYFLDRGLNYVQINSMWGIIVFTMFLAEIPTGLLADRWERRKAIQAAILFQFIGELLFLFIIDYWLLVIDAIIGGIGFAFGSGALEALIYDQLKAENRPDQMQKVMGQLNGASYLGFIVSFGLSGLMVPQASQTNIKIAILSTAIAVGLGFLLTLFLQEEKAPEAPGLAQAQSIRYLKEGIALLRHNHILQGLVLLSVLTIAFWDYLINLYPPYFQNIGVPDRLLGPTLALASLAAFLASNFVHAIARKIGPRRSMALATLGPGIIYLVLFINRMPWLGILCVVLFRGFNALKHPLFADYQNRQIASSNRATVLSMINMIASVYTAGMGLLIGAIAEHSLSLAFLFTGAVVAIAALSILLGKKQLLSGSLE